MALPADGIYAGRCKVKGAWVVAATHIGPAPTIGRSSRAVEAHLLDANVGDLYGQPVALECRARLRDVGQFAAVDDLVKQMKRDVAQVKEIAKGW